MKIIVEKKKKIKQQYGCEHYKNLSENEKMKLGLCIEKNIIRWEILIEKILSLSKESIRNFFFCTYVWKVFSNKTCYIFIFQDLEVPPEIYVF